MEQTLLNPRLCRSCNVEYVMRPVFLGGELFPRFQKICPKCTGYFEKLYDEPKDDLGEYYKIKNIEHKYDFRPIKG